MSDDQPTYLVAGATGFVGRHLVPALLTDGARVRCLSRDPERARRILPEAAELVAADLEADPESELAAKMAGVDVAYFLVHLIDQGADYPERERVVAERFARAASEAGLDRIIYLGGLGTDSGASTHLSSRHETAKALAEHGPPLTYFRAAMIVGVGSESYELLRSLATRLPFLPTAGWMEGTTQPIGIREVVRYLRDAPRVPESAGAEVQIGGPDKLTYVEAIERMAREMGRSPPPRVPVPARIVNPDVVAAAAAAITRGSPAVAAELSHGIVGDTDVEDPSGAAPFGIRSEPLNVIVQRALAEEERARG